MKIKIKIIVLISKKNLILIFSKILKKISTLVQTGNEFSESINFCVLSFRFIRASYISMITNETL